MTTQDTTTKTLFFIKCNYFYQHNALGSDLKTRKVQISNISPNEKKKQIKV